MKNIISDVFLFALAFLLQDILARYVDLNNIFVDLISYVAIYMILYIVYTAIRSAIKHRQEVKY